jgi:hypothetical protein
MTFLRLVASALLCVTAVTACGDDDDTGTGPPSGSARTVRYEMSGTYTVPLVVAYTSASGGSATANVTTLPWSLNVTYLSSVGTIAFTPGALGGAASNAGQTLTGRIISGGTVVRTQTATAPATGQLNFGALVYTFP